MRWSYKPIPDSTTVDHLASVLSISKPLATILAQRGITNFDEAKDFFRPSLDNLHDPYLMKDMDVAVTRINKAVEAQESILVYGDYDVDGTTSVALMSTYLKELTSKVETYIPDRYNEGYGVSYQGIDYAASNGFSLIIALDCGIKAIDKVAYAKEKGIDFIICDHHKPGDSIPEATAVLNPKRTDCNYPFKELCGCGVGFKLIQAHAQQLGKSIEDLTPYLDLVATAIAADIVPMVEENRILAFHGLKMINSEPRLGIKSLIQNIQKKELTITDVVFTIAPRINAAGRIKHGNYAVELLVETDAEKAQRFSKEIDTFNSYRKELDKQITDEALQQIIENDEEQNFSTVVFSETWHKGVIGIVASRLTETYYRPTLVFTKSGEKLAASARSVKGFDVYNAIEQCSEFVEQFGGHKYAAGLTLLPQNYSAFKQKFEEIVSSTIPEQLLTPEILIDTKLELHELTPKFYRILEQMAPFGPQNMRPVFTTEGVRDNGYGKKVGKDLSHLKMSLINGSDKSTYNAIGFGMGNKFKQVNNDFSIAYSVDKNEWNGFTSLQLLLKDLK